MGTRQRNRVKTKKGMWIVVAAALVVSASLMIGKYNLQKKSTVLATKQERLEAQIEEANDKKEELDNQEAYMQTDEYAEEIAREKLGMVKDDEILFKAKDK